MALKVANTDNPALEEARRASLTASPLHVGRSTLGYRSASQFAKNLDAPISLGTATAISGAKASANSGYHSSPIVSFLMAMFNARLGWWLLNPGLSGQATYRYSSPRWALGPLFKPMLNKLFGITENNPRYLSVSDGRHFEGLGLYEMVLRRCRFILVVDASQDENHSFYELANGLRKVRTNLGVHITLRQIRILPRKSRKRKTQPESAKYCAIGEIHYRELGEPENGRLLYIKPTLCPDDRYLGEPVDLYNYGQMRDRFPHDEAQTDQWLTEAQFESYRILGANIIERLWLVHGRNGTDPLSDLFERAEDYLVPD